MSYLSKKRYYETKKQNKLCVCCSTPLPYERQTKTRCQGCEDRLVGKNTIRRNHCKGKIQTPEIDDNIMNYIHV